MIVSYSRLRRCAVKSGGLMNNSGRGRNDLLSGYFDQKSAVHFFDRSLEQMFQAKVVFNAMHPDMHMGIFRQVQAGLVGETGIGHQRHIGQ